MSTQEVKPVGEHVAPKRPRWLIPAIVTGAGVAIVAAVVIIVAVNARPSMKSVADDCGGTSVGVLADGNVIDLYPGMATTGAFVCVTDKLISDTGDQYKVAAAVDAGSTTTLHVDGYQIDITVTADGTEVSFMRQ